MPVGTPFSALTTPKLWATWQRGCSLQAVETPLFNGGAYVLPISKKTLREILTGHKRLK